MTAMNQLYAPLGAVTIPIMEQYCRRHGYDLIVGEYHDRAETQHDRVTRGDLCKAGMYLNNYHKYDILMWLDLDAIPMNHQIPIDAVLDGGAGGMDRALGYLPRRDWLWTCDMNGPCSGFWIARTTPLIRKWVERFSFMCAYEDGGGDQGAMQIVMQRPPFRFIADETHCVYGKTAGHCYPYDVMGIPDDYAFFNKYEPGDWLITVPGMDVARRIQILSEYATRIM